MTNVEIPDDVADRFLKAISAEKKTAVREGEDADAIDYYGNEPTLVHAVIRWWEERARPTPPESGGERDE